MDWHKGVARTGLIFGLSVVLVIGAVVAVGWKRRRLPAPAPAPVPMATSTTQATRPVATSRPNPPPAVATTYLDAVRAEYPRFPTTQPLNDTLALHEAAHLVFNVPIMLSGAPRNELWITRPDAPPTPDVLQAAIDREMVTHEHVLRESVAFVHWMPVENGSWPPYLICRRADGGFDLVTAAERKPLPATRAYQWDHAFSWNNRIVVPTTGGISVLAVGPGPAVTIDEVYCDLLENVAATTAPASAPAVPATEPASRSTLQASVGPTQMTLYSSDSPSSPEGLLAWIPWEGSATGSRGAARFLDGRWSVLPPESGWPAKPLHLVPLLDGSVLILARGQGAAISIEMTTLSQPQVDTAKIEQLVELLSDAEQVKRDEAFQELTRYGPGIWPVLQKLFDDQPPEAQARLKRLLHEKTQPTLGGMTLLGDKAVRIAAHLADGGIVAYAEAGVSIPSNSPDDNPDLRVPAWISIRPGRAVELLPDALTHDLTAGKSSLFAFGNTWVVSGDANGPRRFIGNGFLPLLRKDESAFSRLVGIDDRGRWLLTRDRLADTQPAIGQFLVIDPALPSPVPRLPGWDLPPSQVVGWDKDNWPVIKDGSAYALMEADWRLLEASDKVYTRVEDMPPTTLPSGPATNPSTQPTTAPVAATVDIASTQPTATPTIQPTTAPTTGPTTRPTTGVAEDLPAYVAPDGTRYFGGLTDLRAVPANGHAVTWTLPATAVGRGPAYLVGTKDGRLFLFNEPGRLLRIKPQPGEAEPFVIEATFTRHIPSSDVTRIWVDPVGRIAIIAGARLTLLFPDGYIPAAISKKMLNTDLPEE